MAFVIDDNDVVTSFAEMQDVLDRDQRLFDSNEGLSNTVVDAHLVRATERILHKIRATEWWRDHMSSLTAAVDPSLIIGRQSDFTDLCVYVALSDYILPTVADFGTEDNAERQKMTYYKDKAEALFIELINDGTWYDFDGSGTVETTEQRPTEMVRKRVR